MINFTKSWMRCLDSNKKISEFTIPGTHDTMTYTITKGLIKGLPNEALEGILGSLSILPFAPVAAVASSVIVEVIYRMTNCQTLTLKEQLEAGIRFLDLRLRKEGNKLEAFHGGIKLHINFDEIQDICVRFLNENPEEMIIVSIKNDDKNRENTEDIYTGFWPSVNSVKYKDYWYTKDEIPALKEVRKKMVLLRRFYSKRQPYPVGIDAWGEEWPKNKQGLIRHACTIDVQDAYDGYPLGKQDKKFNQHVKPQLGAAGNNQSGDTLYINFTSGTGGVYPKTLATGYMSFFEGTNSLLYKYLLNHAVHHYGIIPMDFPEYPNNGSLIQQLILSNDFSRSVSEVKNDYIYEIRNGLGFDSCLDVWLNKKVIGSEVKISRVHGGNNQAWRFKSLSHNEHGQRYGQLTPQSAPNLVLDVHKDSRPVAFIRENISNDDQRFLLQYSGEGYFMIRPSGDLNKVLDVPVVNESAFGDILLSDCSGPKAKSAGQQWKLQPVLYKSKARALHVYHSASLGTHCFSLVQTSVLKGREASDYIYMGIVGYIFDEQVSGTVPLYESTSAIAGHSPHYSLDSSFFPYDFSYLIPSTIVGYVYPPHAGELAADQCCLYRWKPLMAPNKELYTTDPNEKPVSPIYAKDRSKYGGQYFDHICILVSK
jgi:hypothetical protein